MNLYLKQIVNASLVHHQQSCSQYRIGVLKQSSLQRPYSIPSQTAKKSSPDYIFFNPEILSEIGGGRHGWQSRYIYFFLLAINISKLFFKTSLNISLSFILSLFYIVKFVIHVRTKAFKLHCQPFSQNVTFICSGCRIVAADAGGCLIQLPC